MKPLTLPESVQPLGPTPCPAKFPNIHESSPPIFKSAIHHESSAIRDVGANMLSFNEKKCLGLSLSLDIVLCATKDGRPLLCGIFHGSIFNAFFLPFLDFSKLALLGGSGGLLLLLWRCLWLGSLGDLGSSRCGGLLLWRLLCGWRLLVVGDGLLRGLLLLIIFLGLLDDTFVAFGTGEALVEWTC